MTLSAAITAERAVLRVCLTVERAWISLKTCFVNANVLMYFRAKHVAFMWRRYNVAKSSPAKPKAKPLIQGGLPLEKCRKGIAKSRE